MTSIDLLLIKTLFTDSKPDSDNTDSSCRIFVSSTRSLDVIDLMFNFSGKVFLNSPIDSFR